MGESPANIQSVPLLDLKTQYASIRDEIQAAIARVVESQYFILGPEVKALEAEIAAYSACEYGVGMSSGSDALLASLMSLEIGPGDEVITTPFTFFSTVGAIARLGATMRLVDIDPVSFNIDPAQIEAAITPHTKAIIPVHLYGQVADMAPIMAAAEKHGITVIEDAAQAIGAEYRGQRAGSIGHMGCFSFFPSKNLGAYGDAGMVVTRDANHADRLALYRNHGHRPKYRNKAVGGNFRLDAIQAAVLRVKLPYLDGWTQARQRNASLYREAFQQAGLVVAPEFATTGTGFETRSTVFDGNPGVILPQERDYTTRHIYNQFVIRAPQRDALKDHLKARGIGTEVYYPVPMHLQECFADLDYAPGQFPLSEAAANEALALPVYPEVTPEMIGYVVEQIAAFYSG